MRLPWVSRSAHETVTALLSTQVAELKEERKILLDRLATLGLGGPLYAQQEQEAETEEEPELAPDPEQKLVEELMRLRHRPARLADTLTRRAYRERNKPFARPKASRSPQMEKVQAALDEAEESGKRSAAGSL